MGDYWTQRSAYTVPPSHWQGHYPGEPSYVYPTYNGHPVVNPRFIADSCDFPSHREYSEYDPANDHRIAAWAQGAQAGHYPAPPSTTAPSSHYTNSELRSGISHEGNDPSWVYHQSNHHYQNQYRHDPSIVAATYTPSYVTGVTQATRGSGSATLVGSGHQQGVKKGGLKALFGNGKPMTTTWYAGGNRQPPSQEARRGAKLQKTRPAVQAKGDDGGKKKKGFFGFVIERDYTEPLIRRA